MPRSRGNWLLALAARRELRVAGRSVGRTPILVPSFSSRVPEIEKIFRACEEFIDGPILISAFDVARKVLSPPYDFASFIILDSGGYEISDEPDLSDVSGRSPDSKSWSVKDHAEALASWRSRVPTLVVTYDHPSIRHSVDKQIELANGLALPSGVGRQLLFKPETTDQKFIPIKAVLASVEHLGRFDAIGVTEKEIGNSILERMKNIAQLRLALRRVGLDTPIHVFGSMDTVTTLFYFVAGADIFDGLTWLRYGFKEGNTLYKQNFGILDLGITIKSPIVEAVCWSKNYQYIREMELEMRRFLKEHDFGVFKYHGQLLAAAYKSVEEELGG